MESEHKDYAYKNEISLSIGDDSVDSSASTPSTVTPQAPTPSPRALNDDTKPLTKNGDMMKPEGIDNKAFDNASEKPPLSSFGNGQLNETANGANKNGQLNEKKLAEAVNLELININSNNNNNKKSSNGKNGSDLPVKKDGDVEMGHTKDESYDEYFVPVNEHRKYMRGEKLYVTKDKRTEKRKSKLCWILCIGVVAAVLILGILLASGAFSRSDTPVEARQFGDKTNSSQVVGAGFAVPSDTTSTAQTTTTTTTELPITMPPYVDETSPEPAVVHEEEITYVPNSLEGQITLSNAEYSTEYNDPNSPIYKKLIKDLENEIKNALSSGGNDEFFVKIIGLKSGSVVVDYRVSWKSSDTDLSSDEMKQRIQNFLNRHNHQFMSRYTVNENTIRVARVPDRCATSSKNNCDHACEFSTDKVDFQCTCPPGKKFDEDWNECIGDHDSVYVSPETSSEPEPTSEPSAEPTLDDDHSHHHHHHSEHDASTAEPSSAEPSAEPEPSSDDSEHKSSTAEPEPSSSEPSAEPEPSSDDEHSHHHHSHDESSTAEPTPSVSEPSAEPEPSSDDSEHKSSTAEPEPSVSEPSAEPTSDDEHSHHQSSTAEPSAAEPSAEPEPSSDDSEHKSSTADLEPSVAEPSAEPSSDDSEHKSSTAEPEPSVSEPSAEPEPTADDNENKSSTAEPSAEPSSNDNESSTAEPTSDDQKHLVKQFKLLDEPENATSSKPVNEEVDDTPQPTETYVVVTTPRAQNEINIFDMNMTTQSNETSSVYSTSSPVSIWQNENGSESHDMSPFLPESENLHSKTEQKIYSVTENISEGDIAPHDQSPFLPEPENKHILVGTHGTTPLSEETEEVKNATHTDSPIINVIPIRVENTTSPAVSTSSSIVSESSTTTVKHEDEEEEKEEGGDDENLFGDDLKKGDELEMVPSSTEVTVELKNETSTEGVKVESNIEVLTTVHHHHESSSTTEIPASSSEISVSSSETPLSSTETVETTTPQEIKSTEEVKVTEAIKSTTEEVKESSEIPITTTIPDLNDKAALLDYDTNNELLSVVPLSKSATPLTTTEQPNLTSENEITEKISSTTDNFLDITTFPSVVKQTVEEDEASLNRNGKVIPDEYYNKADNKLEKTEETKLFKPEFLESIPACPEDKFKCVYSNECVSKVKVCDGKPQCADYSDEWNCYNLTSSNILEHKQEEKMLKICATKWTKTMSDRACNKLGFAGSDEWKANKEVKEEKYLMVADQFDKFEFVESCEDGVVEVHCIDYACGSNSTNRDAGEFSSISLVVNKDSTRRCTANVISPVWAITSAACVGKPTEDWVLIAGNTELNMSKISKNSVISLVSEIVTFQGNDYALLQLKQVLTFSNLVYAACLNKQPFKDNNECLTTGWLTRADNSLEKYEKIMEVHANCSSESTNQLCAMPKNKPSDECYNDKGSSLYCFSQDEKRWLLNGIQNQESACSDETEPLKFSSLSRDIINWIKNTVGNSRMFV